MSSEYSNSFHVDPSLKDDIHKIQMEIIKLNKRFEKEIASCECKQPSQPKKQTNAPTEKKLKKPFIISNPQNINFPKKNLGFSITPKVLNLFNIFLFLKKIKVTEVQHSFVKKTPIFHTKHHLDDTEM